MKDVYILGIESSCDETSAAIIKNDYILATVTATQQIHEKYGGVVPEIASREHQINMIPVVKAAILQSGIRIEQIDAVAFTRGPGLIGPLLVGTSFAKGFSLALDIPIIEVNHMQAHILAHFIKDAQNKEFPLFPFICLTVSGGHTQLVVVKDYFKMEIIGETIDDAAGEAFDKAAKILGIAYPGGPLMDKLARTGDPLKFKFTEPVVPNFDFSFSGLKTNILYFIQREKLKNSLFIEENINDLCASIQKTIVSILIKKLTKACAHYKIPEIAIAGGVSANSGLRSALLELEKKGFKAYIPKMEYCTDNAAMIAITGYYKYLNNDFANQSITPLARMPL